MVQVEEKQGRAGVWGFLKSIKASEDSFSLWNMFPKGQWYFYTQNWYFRTNLKSCAVKRPIHLNFNFSLTTLLITTFLDFPLIFYFFHLLFLSLQLLIITLPFHYSFLFYGEHEQESHFYWLSPDFINSVIFFLLFYSVIYWYTTFFIFFFIFLFVFFFFFFHYFYLLNFIFLLD